jgi:hypothetical protein
MRRIAISLIALSLVIGGCIGPPVLERGVLSYDEVTSTLEQKLLLLNIARADAGRPVHFTTTSSIAATFDWTTATGVGGGLQAGHNDFGFFNADLRMSASENPTFSIIPISGEEFTKRILTPFKDEAFEFLVSQGAPIDRVLRLMAAGVEIQNPDGSFVRFVGNDPRRAAEYEEFRRLVSQLFWLNEQRKLFIRPLVFQQTLVADFQGIPRSEDITKGVDKGLEWRQKPDGNFELVRLRAGRIAITNFDPMALSDLQRFELNERIPRNPKGFVYLEVRPDGPGGDLPVQGAFKLRSIIQIVEFIAAGIRSAPEFEVAPDPRTAGAVGSNPPALLQIDIGDDPPLPNLASLGFQGRRYTVIDTEWNREVFSGLGYLFQSAIGDIEGVGLPITIAK